MPINPDVLETALNHIFHVVKWVLENNEMPPELPPEEPPEEPLWVGITLPRSLNVRSGVGTIFPILDSLFQGTEVLIYEIAGEDSWDEWVRIGNGRWCASVYHGERFIQEI